MTYFGIGWILCRVVWAIYGFMALGLLCQWAKLFIYQLDFERLWTTPWLAAPMFGLIDVEKEISSWDDFIPAVFIFMFLWFIGGLLTIVAWPFTIFMIVFMTGTFLIKQYVTYKKVNEIIKEN